MVGGRSRTNGAKDPDLLAADCQSSNYSWVIRRSLEVRINQH